MNKRVVRSMVLLWLVGALGIGLGSCMSMTEGLLNTAVRRSVRGAPAINRVFMHHNPGVGDYAVQRTTSHITQMGVSSYGVTTNRLEVIDIDSEGIHVKMTIDSSTYDEDFRKSDLQVDFSWFYYHLIVDESGDVARAFMVETTKTPHTREEIPVAQPGDDGYINPQRISTEPILVPHEKRDYESDVYFQSLEHQSPSLRVGAGYVIFVSPEMPFGMVAQYSVVDTETRYTYEEVSRNKITTYLITESTQTNAVTEVIEYGRGSEHGS